MDSEEENELLSQAAAEVEEDLILSQAVDKLEQTLAAREIPLKKSAIPDAFLNNFSAGLDIPMAPSLSSVSHLPMIFSQGHGCLPKAGGLHYRQMSSLYSASADRSKPSRNSATATTTSEMPSFSTTADDSEPSLFSVTVPYHWLLFPSRH